MKWKKLPILLKPAYAIPKKTISLPYTQTKTDIPQTPQLPKDSEWEESWEMKT